MQSKEQKTKRAWGGLVPTAHRIIRFVEADGFRWKKIGHINNFIGKGITPLPKIIVPLSPCNPYLPHEPETEDI